MQNIEIEEKIVKDFLNWIKTTHIDLFINEYIKVITKYLHEPYYEHYYDGNPYDCSGELTTTMSLNIDNINTISDLLDCYLGYWTPTYISGCGKHYQKVSDEIYMKMTELYSIKLYEYIRLNPIIFGIEIDKYLDDDDIFELIESNFDYLWFYDLDVIEMVENFIGVKRKGPL